MDYVKITFIVFILFQRTSLSATVVSLCEGESQQIECPNGQTMSILEVFYGRSDQHYCEYERDLNFLPHNCVVPNAVSTVKRLCDGRQSCSLQASHNLFGEDECSGTLKVLVLEYRCVRGLNSHIATNQQGVQRCGEVLRRGIHLPASIPGELVTVACPRNPGLTTAWQCGVNPVMWFIRQDLDKCSSLAVNNPNQQEKTGGGSKDASKPGDTLHLDEQDLFGNSDIFEDLDFDIEHPGVYKVSRDLNSNAEIIKRDDTLDGVTEKDGDKEKEENTEEEGIEGIEKEKETIEEDKDEVIDKREEEETADEQVGIEIKVKDEKDEEEEDEKDGEEDEEKDEEEDEEKDEEKENDEVKTEEEERRDENKNEDKEETESEEDEEKDEKQKEIIFNETEEHDENENSTEILHRPERSVYLPWKHSSEGPLNETLQTTIITSSPELTDLVIPIESMAIHSTGAMYAGDHINISKSTLMAIGEGEVLQLNFDVYENMDQIYLNNKGRSLRNTAPNNDTIVNKQLLSKIIVISVKPIDILKQNKIPQIPTKLEYPVYFALSHLEISSNVSCAYWNYVDNKADGWWSEEGCSLVQSSTSQTSCLCHYLSYYALLLDTSLVSPNTNITRAPLLEILVLATCMTSVVVLMSALLGYHCKYRQMPSDNEDIEKYIFI